MTISENGISEPVIRDSIGPAINADVYQNECLPFVNDFINTYHNDNNYVFWPDLASSHYAKTTQEWLHDRGINFVPKSVNPPNVPKARPIENFWGILVSMIYAEGCEAKSTRNLKLRIKKMLR